MKPTEALEKQERDQYTPAEEKAFVEQERIIDNGLQSFTEVAGALTYIREHRLYRSEYASFQQYCEKRWGFTRRWADELIAAAGIVSEISTSHHSDPKSIEDIKDASAKTVILLKKVKPQNRAKVIARAAQKSNGRPITPTVMKEAVASFKHKPVPRQEPPPRQGPETHPVLSAMEEWFNTELRNSAYGPGLTARGVFNGLLEVVRKQVVK